MQINRTDLAEKVVALQQGLRDTSQISSSPCEINQATPASPVCSSGIEDTSPSAATSCSFPLAIKDKQTVQVVKETLTELEEEFLKLVMFIEDALEKSQVKLNTITRRFSMLPQSVKRQHETDEKLQVSKKKYSQF